MTRPEDVPQWAWDEAGKALYLDSEMPDQPPYYMVPTLISVARAILKAREEAFEEAAKIAEGRTPLWEEAEAIASAIRQHSQKGER